MKLKIASVACVASILLIGACSPLPALKQAYWQRVEDNSALYMQGPKAQQTLDENIAGCVREVDELVELGALRETMPPDTHGEYHQALEKSGDLAYYDTPARYGNKKVDHKDFHDFESCMRSKGWERVRFVRYQTSLKAKTTYKETQDYRKTGLFSDAAEAKRQEEQKAQHDQYAGVNR